MNYKMLQTLAGVYHLRIYEVRTPGTSFVKTVEDAEGQLIYTETGFMSVGINSKLGAAHGGSNSVFYTGEYRLVGDTHVEHIVHTTNLPQFSEQIIRREIERTGTDLILIGRGLLGGDHYLYWTRID